MLCNAIGAVSRTKILKELQPQVVGFLCALVSVSLSLSISVSTPQMGRLLNGAGVGPSRSFIRHNLWVCHAEAASTASRQQLPFPQS